MNKVPWVHAMLAVDDVGAVALVVAAAAVDVAVVGFGWILATNRRSCLQKPVFDSLFLVNHHRVVPQCHDVHRPRYY